MTGEEIPLGLGPDSAHVVDSIVAEASERARAAAVDWLVPQLVQAYQQAVRERFGAAIGPREASERPEEVAQGSYVYSVCDAELVAGDATGLVGIDGAPVTALTHNQLCALVSPVQLDRFRDLSNEADIDEHGWLALAVRAHESVVETGLGRVAILPMRFGAVYASADSVAEALARHETALLEELRRLGRSTEWGVKVATSPQLSASAETPATGGREAIAASGTAWMLNRQTALASGRRRDERMSACLDDLRSTMSPLARDVAVSRPAAGNEERRSLSFLVDDVATFRREFSACQKRHESQGLTLELTGPWPPYHFVRAPF